MERESIVKVAGEAAKRWARDLPFQDGEHRQLFIDRVASQIFEAIKEPARLLTWWQVHIESYPRRNFVHPFLREGAELAHLPEGVFLLLPGTTMLLNHKGIEVSEDFGAWQTVYEVAPSQGVPEQPG